MEVRGGGAAPEVALADRRRLRALWAPVAAGAPASVVVPRGSSPIGVGDALRPRRRLDSNTGDSAYAAVAAGAGGVQIVRAPRDAGRPRSFWCSSPPGPRSAWPAPGPARSAWRWERGVALLRAPAAADLNQIGPAAPPPYTAPVVLSRVQSWGASGGLERALHLNWARPRRRFGSATTRDRFRTLMVSDGTRLLVLRPGTAAITGVAVAEHSLQPRRPARRTESVAGRRMAPRRRARRCSRPAPSRAPQ